MRRIVKPHIVVLVLLTLFGGLLVGCSAEGEAAIEIEAPVQASPQPTQSDAGEQPGTEAEPESDTAEPAASPDEEATAPPADNAGDDGATANAQANLSAAARGQVDINCTETNPHPVGQSIAETYDVTYEDVMTWFCSENTFDDIMLAIETSEEANVAVDTLLDMRQQDRAWDDIWTDVGVLSEQ